MILAGDIGGTHARLAFFDVLDGRFSLVSASIFPSREYSGLDEIVAKFVDTANLSADTACFGIAGPVRNGRVEASNLPWIIESKRLAEELKISKALLINDLEANAWGIPALEAKDVVALNHVKGQADRQSGGDRRGNRTGRSRNVLGRGASTRFLPVKVGTEILRREIHWKWSCSTIFAPVSATSVTSGLFPVPGLVNVFSFLRDTGRGTPPQWLTDEMAHSDPAAAISRAGMDGKCSAV